MESVRISISCSPSISSSKPTKVPLCNFSSSVTADKEEKKTNGSHWQDSKNEWKLKIEKKEKKMNQKRKATLELYGLHFLFSLRHSEMTEEKEKGLKGIFKEKEKKKKKRGSHHHTDGSCIRMHTRQKWLISNYNHWDDMIAIIEMGEVLTRMAVDRLRIPFQLLHHHPSWSWKWMDPGGGQIDQGKTCDT